MGMELTQELFDFWAKAVRHHLDGLDSIQKNLRAIGISDQQIDDVFGIASRIDRAALEQEATAARERVAG